MSRHPLRISDDLSLPLDAITQTFAIFGIRGSGKTHTATVMVEEMLKAGQPVCIYDPVGAWFGLKSSADGKSAGFPVVVFGGEHADVPLAKEAGETIAGVIVERRIPAILDVSLMRKGERVQFMTKFCETLYHKNREPLHFIVDEAHTICPMNIRAMPEAAPLLGAMEDIVLQGRKRGLGLTVVSQRPALVHTNVRTQCATLVAMRIIGPHDLKAIQEWTDAHGKPEQAKQLMESLPTLKTGEGWVWSPAWLDVFKRVTFRQRETFDSGATPEVGKRALAPKVLAAVDLDALGREIQSTVERAKADDPRALRAELAKVKAELARAQAAKPAPAATKTVEKAVLKDGQITRLDRLLDRLNKMVQAQDAFSGRLFEAMAQMRGAIGKMGQTAAHNPAHNSPAFPARPPASPRPSLGPLPLAAGWKPARPAPADRVPGGLAPGDSGARANGAPAKGELKVLTVLAQYPAGATREQITVLTGYKKTSRDTYLQRLRQRGLADQNETGDAVIATAAGMAALGPDFKPLPTGQALQQYWRDRLPDGERKILDLLITAYPQAVLRSDLDEPTGYKKTSRDTYIQRLGARKLVKILGRGQVAASDELF